MFHFICEDHGQHRVNHFTWQPLYDVQLTSFAVTLSVKRRLNVLKYVISVLTSQPASLYNADISKPFFFMESSN